MKKAKSKVALGNLIRVCPCKNHAWFESSAGPVRKPYVAENKKEDVKETLNKE